MLYICRIYSLDSIKVEVDYLLCHLSVWITVSMERYTHVHIYLAINVYIRWPGIYRKFRSTKNKTSKPVSCAFRCTEKRHSSWHGGKTAPCPHHVKKLNFKFVFITVDEFSTIIFSPVVVVVVFPSSWRQGGANVHHSYVFIDKLIFFACA